MAIRTYEHEFVEGGFGRFCSRAQGLEMVHLYVSFPLNAVAILEVKGTSRYFAAEATIWRAS